jgi:hypothetical protein
MVAPKSLKINHINNTTMQTILKATVPPTNDLGSCVLLGTSTRYETFRENILWQYNKLRQHDGLDEVTRMPAGTQYEKKHYFG